MRLVSCLPDPTIGESKVGKAQRPTFTSSPSIPLAVDNPSRTVAPIAHHVYVALVALAFLPLLDLVFLSRNLEGVLLCCGIMDMWNLDGDIDIEKGREANGLNDSARARREDELPVHLASAQHQC